MLELLMKSDCDEFSVGYMRRIITPALEEDPGRRDFTMLLETVKDYHDDFLISKEDLMEQIKVREAFFCQRSREISVRRRPKRKRV